MLIDAGPMSGLTDTRTVDMTERKDLLDCDCDESGHAHESGPCSSPPTLTYMKGLSDMRMRCAPCGTRLTEEKGWKHTAIAPMDKS